MTPGRIGSMVGKHHALYTRRSRRIHSVGRGILFCAVFVLLNGCSYTDIPVRIPTAKQAEVLEVDRELNTVRMGSPYLYLEKPDVDWAKARADAAAQCAKMHGFNDAEPVGTTRRECLSWTGGDCVRYAIVGDYRCIP